MDDTRYAQRRYSRPQTAPSTSADPGRIRGRTPLRPPYGASYDHAPMKPAALSALAGSSRAGMKSKIMSSVKRSLSHTVEGKKPESGPAVSPSAVLSGHASIL